MKNFLPLLLFLVLSCSPSHKDRDKLNIFLLEWSKAMSTGNEMEVRKFYDARFVFPKILIDLPDGVKYQFDVPNIQLSSGENDSTLYATVPFSLTSTSGINNSGSIELTISKKESGFLITGMTQELAIRLKEYGLRLEMNNKQSELVFKYDSILGGVRAIANTLSKQYDSVVFFARIDTVTLYYVVNGDWIDPYIHDDQRDAGNYKMGIVTAGNKVIIPVEYDKIYNPNGSFYGMIEVERKGLRGLFRTDGSVFLACEYNGIYPIQKDAFAQVRKGDQYGWVDDSGHVFFETNSEINKKLIQSPVENGSILTWEFAYPGQTELLINPYVDASEATGTIIYPSYLRDFGITSIANGFVMLAASDFGMGMTDTSIKFERSETLSDKFYGLIAFFMESGADARGYQTRRNDLLVVDKEMQIVSNVKGFTEDNGNQDPCGEQPVQYKIIEPGLYESSDGHGNYKYYHVTIAGNIEPQETTRKYNFTKFAKIDAHYFDACNYTTIPYEERGNDELNPNVVINHGISANDLDVMRNEIFAEYGFIFKSEKWKNYFEKQPWYKPQYENVDKFLSEKDKYNVKFILDYQRSHKGLEVQRDSIQFMWAG